MKDEGEGSKNEEKEKWGKSWWKWIVGGLIVLLIGIGGWVGWSKYQAYRERQRRIEQRKEQKARQLIEEAREARSEGYAGAPEAAAKLEKAVKLDPDNWKLRKKLVEYYMDMAGHFRLDRTKIDQQLLKAIDIEGASRLKLLRLLERAGSPKGKKKARQILEKEFPYSALRIVKRIAEVNSLYPKNPQKARAKVRRIQHILDENTITNLPYKWYKTEEAIRYKLLMRDYHGERRFGDIQRAVKKWKRVIRFKNNHPNKHLNLVSGTQSFENSTSDLVAKLYEERYYQQTVSMCNRFVKEPREVYPVHPNYKICAFALVKTGEKQEALKILNKRRLFYERSLESQLDRIEFAESEESNFYDKYPYKRREHKEGLENTRQQIEKFENLIQQVKKGDLQ